MTKRTWAHWMLCALCVVIAVVFYGNFRGNTWLGEMLGWTHFSIISGAHIPAILLDHLPSYLQSLFLGLSYLLLTRRSVRGAMTFSLLTAGILEISQTTTLLVGIFDWMDMGFILLGSLSLKFIVKERPPKNLTQPSPSLPVAALALFSYVVSMGCLSECDPEDEYCVYPVTITWEEIRAEIQPSYGNETQLTRAGKVHVKGDHLFIIDEYRGVHIFDQTDPLNPTRLAFIPIIGALDLSFNGDYLYINSFTDLVVIQYLAVVNGSFTQEHVTRKINVFGPTKSYDFLPEGYRIEGSIEKYSDYRANWLFNPDKYPKKGLIIGYYDSNMEPVIFADYKMEGVQ